MRLINTRAHGIYDYLLGVLLFSCASVFGYEHNGIAQIIATSVGVSMALLAFFTNFELSLGKFVPLKHHLVIDIFLGLFLASSPWVFHFSSEVFKPHFVFGLSIIAVSFLTDRLPSKEARKLMKAKHDKPAPAKVMKKHHEPKAAFKLIYDSPEYLLLRRPADQA